MIRPSPPPALGPILGQASTESKPENNRRAAQAKERDKLLAQHPVCRRRRASETWFLPQLVYHLALCVVENRPPEWWGGRSYWSGLTGYSVTTTSQNYAALSQDGLIEVEHRAPKGWNGWQTNMVRPGRVLMPAVWEQARKIRAARTRAAKYAEKKTKLSLTPGIKEKSEVSDNFRNKGPSGGLSTQLGKTAFAAMNQILLRAPPPKSPA